MNTYIIINYMNPLQTNMHFPDNVLRNIAGFLQPIENDVKIRIEQFCGCPVETHAMNYNCDNCKSTYTNRRIYFYLYKNGNKHIFKKFIDTITKITQDPEFPLKSNLGHWINMAPLTKPYWTMRHLFKNNEKILFEKMPTQEDEKYDEKYMMTGTCFALFSTYIRDLINHVDFTVKKRSFYETVHSSALYYIISNNNKFLKNHLAITNKIFQKYTFPQYPFNN